MSFTLEFLEAEILKTVKSQEASTSFRVRLSVYRQDGGLYTPTTNNIDYLILVDKGVKKGDLSGKRMVVLRKYQPITVTLNPLFCVATPIYKFPVPRKTGFIDHESIVYKTSNLNTI